MWMQVEQSLRQSMDRVIMKLAALLPGILSFAAALLLFVLIAWLLAFLASKLVIAVKLDERLRSGSHSLSELSPTQTPSRWVVRVVFWITVLAGVMVGLSAFEAAAAETGIATYILAYVPRIIGAAVLLTVGSMLARFLSRSVLITSVNMNLSYARLLSTGVRWLILVLTGAMILDHLSIGGTVVELAFGILFGGIVFALSLAVGLGSRDLVSRSLERDTRLHEVPTEEKLHHF